MKSVKVITPFSSQTSSCNSTIISRHNSPLSFLKSPTKPSPKRQSVLQSLYSRHISPCDKILRFCGQAVPIKFDDFVRSCQILRKLGEGSFAEVFETKNGTILKVMPFGSPTPYNLSPQKSAEEVLPEIVISKYLYGLRTNDRNRTSGFVELIRSVVVEGRFPPLLVDLWEDYHQEVSSQNDHPEIFEDSQQFVVVELGNGGTCLEDFEFDTHKQQYEVMVQLAFSLAVAESVFEFEHRDLHVGNVLVSRSAPEEVVLDWRDLSGYQRDHSVRVTIIDYTISRISWDGLALFSDIGEDAEIFEGEGGIQFDVYRDMRDLNGNDWRKFEPRTNLLWLEYVGRMLMEEFEVCEDSLDSLYYKKLMEEIVKALPKYSSAANFVDNYFWDAL